MFKINRERLQKDNDSTSNQESVNSAKIELSDEQIAICKSNANEIKVNAFAGTGKTTTLLHYALAHPNQRFLYICYNKSIQLEAQAKFPKNVVTQTSHAIAYKKEGFKYKEKLVPYLNNLAVKKHLKLDKSKNPDVACKILVSTVSNFCASDSIEVKTKHLPLDDLYMSGIIEPNSDPSQRTIIEDAIVRRAQLLWDMMCDLNNPDIGMTHDGYLKLFQINVKQLPFDVIMLDEAQDANPATLAILKSQHSAQKIMVGDTYQSIYTFRGAINAMEEFEKAEQFFLTNSFRFGQDVADYSNYILGMIGETKEIKGLGKTKIEERKDKGLGNYSHKKAVLFRNNNSIFTYAFERIKGKKIYFEGGIKNYNLDSIYDVYNLYLGKTNSIKDPLIKAFPNVQQLQESALINGNPQLVNQCSLVLKYGNNLQSRINDLKSRVVEEDKNADIILTNVHKAKGKEYNEVELDEDFNSSPISPRLYTTYLNILSRKYAGSNPEEFQKVQEEAKRMSRYNVIHYVPQELKEEAHISYVALTRVKNRLILPTAYINTLNLGKELFKQGVSQEVSALMLKQNYLLTEQGNAMLSKVRLERMLSVKIKEDEGKSEEAPKKIRKI
jgi:F-box protein, helicase, 18